MLHLFVSPFFSYPEFYLRSGVWGLALLGGAQVKPILKHFLFFLHQNVSPGRCPSWFKTGGGNVHFFHQDAQGESVNTQAEELKKKEISFCSQSVGVNGVTMAPHLKKPAAAGCLTRFPSLITHHKCIWQRLGFLLYENPTS